MALVRHSRWQKLSLKLGFFRMRRVTDSDELKNAGDFYVALNLPVRNERGELADGGERVIMKCPGCGMEMSSGASHKASFRRGRLTLSPEIKCPFKGEDIFIRYGLARASTHK